MEYTFETPAFAKMYSEFKNVNQVGLPLESQTDRKPNNSGIVNILIMLNIILVIVASFIVYKIHKDSEENKKLQQI